MPAFQYAFEGGEWSIDDVYPNHYFLMNDKIIFVCSRWDACFQQQNARKIYEKLVPTPKILYGNVAAFIMVEHKQDRASFLTDFKKIGISDKKRPKMGLFCSYMTKRDLKHLVSLYLQGE